MAHEMGHYVLESRRQDARCRSRFSSSSGFDLAAAIFNRVIKKRGPSWGVERNRGSGRIPVADVDLRDLRLRADADREHDRSATIEREADAFSGLNAAREPDARSHGRA